MNKTKQFKRTAFNLSAKSMLSLMLLLITMLMPQGAWAISGSGTSSSPYLIANEADLRTFQQYVENGNTGIYGKLTANITLTSAWTRIGRSGQKFTGYFDGQGHTISGMNLSFTAYEHGFFGFVNNATIKNFTLKGTMTSSANGNHSHGTVVGSAAGTTVIENVTSSVNLTLNHTGFTCIGGIVGHMDESSKVIGCTYTGTINLNKDSEQVGGIVGYAQRNLYITDNVFSGTITSTGTCKYLAGIAGKTDGTIEVSGCTNIGTINGGPSYDCVAGIVGYVQYQSRALITNCYFGGSLSSTSSGTSLGMGGILGAVNDDAGTNFRGLTYCFSDGTLTATNSSSTQIGGIAGVIKSKAVSKVMNNTYLSGKASRLAAISNNSSTFDSSNKAITISVTAGTGGSVSKSYVYPTSTTAMQLHVEATPNSGYHYVEWSDNEAQTHNVSLANNVSLEATFGAHTYGNWSTDVDATCTSDGTHHRVCTYAGCGAREDGTIAAKGHGKTNGYTASYNWQGSASDPTCKFTLKCNDCKDSNNNPTVIVNGQSITTTTTGTYGYIKQTAHDDAKCTEAGYTTYQAAGKYSDSNGKNAQYTETTTSNSSNTETYTIAALGHGSTGYTPTYTWGGDYTAATCTFKLECNQCNTEVSTQNLTPTKVDVNHKDATCTEPGNERWTATGSYSKKGDAAYNGTAQVNDYPIPATGIHTFASDDPHQTYCTRCTHTFFRYTATSKVEPNKPTALMNSKGKGIYVKEKNTFDGKNGVIEFNERLVTIGDAAFAGVGTFTGDLIIPNTVITIGSYAFKNCGHRYSSVGFTGNLVIPSSVTSIGQEAFRGCFNFKGKVVIPNSVKSIGPYAFLEFGWNSSFEMQSIPYLGAEALWSLNTTTVVLSEDSYVYKGDNPYFPEVASVTAPCSLDLTDSAVEKHPNLTHTGGSKIEEKDAAHLISSNCITDTYHYSCNLCHKNLPATYTAAGTGAHSYTEESDAEAYLASAAGCADATYYYKCANCDEHGTETWKKSGTGNGQHTFAANDLTHDVCTVCNHGFLRYEAGSQQNPFKAENLKDKGGNTLTIESHTFSDGKGVMEFNAPLVTIGDLAFLGSDIKGITIPNTVVTIGTAAFNANRLISAIEIPNSVKIIGGSAFYGCIALTKITLGSSVEKINGYAFSCDKDQSDKDFDIKLKSLPQFVNCDYPEIFHYTYTYYDEYVGCSGVEDRPIPANFELDDNSYVAPESSLGSSCIANHVTYTRTGIKNQWGTIVVPFAVNGSGDDYDLYTLSSVSSDELTLTKVDGPLPAGIPALIRINSELVGDGKTYDLTLRAVTAEVSGQLQEGSAADGLKLVGTYDVTTLTANDYFISNNKFWRVADMTHASGVKAAPFRAYLMNTGAGAMASALRIAVEDDSATAIDVLNMLNDADAEYYDLNGRRIPQLQKGINIVKYGNGKTVKVSIK